MLTPSEAMQAFDGLMLGEMSSMQFKEGGKDAFFRTVYSDRRDHPVPFKSRVEWVNKSVVEAFQVLGVKIREGYPRMETYAGRTADGKVVQGYVLETEPSPFLTEQFHRWYRTEEYMAG